MAGEKVVMTVRSFPALCTLGEMQYLSPPEGRHTAETVYVVEWEGGKEVFRDSFTCDGKPVHSSEKERQAFLSGKDVEWVYR